MDETWGATHAGCPNVRDATGGRRLNAPWTSAPSRCVVGRRARDVDGCAPARPAARRARNRPQEVFSPGQLVCVGRTEPIDRRVQIRFASPGSTRRVSTSSRPFSTKTSRWKKHARDGFQAHRGASGGTRDARALDDARDDAMYGGDRGYGGYGGGADRGGFGVSGSRAARRLRRVRPNVAPGAGGRAGAPPRRRGGRPRRRVPRVFRCAPTSGGYGQDAGGTGWVPGSRVDRPRPLPGGRRPRTRGRPAGGRRRTPSSSADSAPPPGSCAVALAREGRDPTRAPLPVPAPGRARSMADTQVARASLSKEARASATTPDVLPRLVRHHRR